MSDEDRRHHRPLGDVPDVDRGGADPDRPGDRFDHRAGQDERQTASSAIRTIIARVTSSCSGRSFQNGRPSGSRR